jgi:hypothetical protein
MKMSLSWRPGALNRAHIFSLLFLLTLLSLPLGLAAQISQEREAQAAVSLVQADDAYAQGDYQKAIENYLLVVQTSASKMNLSRAHMGLALCYFYLNDTENAKKYILKVLELDPQKEVSSLFHPQTFVDLFDEVKRANAETLGHGVAVAPALAAQAAQAEQEAKQEQQVIPEGGIEAQGGYWEVEAHVSNWSIDPAKGIFEDELTKKAANEIRDQVTNQLNDQYGGRLVPSANEHNLSMDSSGSNYGLGIRFYPMGRKGFMSIGFSLDKTKIKVTMKGPVTQHYSDGSEAVVEGDAIAETSPLTTNLSFSWDFAPSWRITPYFVFGLGIGPLDGTVNYVYSGTYRRGGAQESVNGGETKTFDQLRDEGDIKLDAAIFLHLALGIRGEVYQGISVKGEAGFWDGLILRAGLAYRF